MARAKEVGLIQYIEYSFFSYIYCPLGIGHHFINLFFPIKYLIC